MKKVELSKEYLNELGRIAAEAESGILDEDDFEDEIKRARDKECLRIDEDFVETMTSRVDYETRASKRGAVILDSLIRCAAMEGADDCRLDGNKASEIFYGPGGLAFYDGYRSLLRHAKRAIKSGDLVIRDISTMAPLDVIGSIRSWGTSKNLPPPLLVRLQRPEFSRSPAR